MLKFHEMAFGPRLPIVPPSNVSAVVVRSLGMPNFQQVRSLGRTSGGSALLPGGECSEKECLAAISHPPHSAMGDPQHRPRVWSMCRRRNVVGNVPRPSPAVLGQQRGFAGTGKGLVG